MLEILKLIRLRTIAFTAFTMYAMRFFVVQPVLEKAGFTLQMPEGNFSLLVIAVCCLVSAAYVINDYFDTKADRISGNRPVIVGKTISRRVDDHSAFHFECRGCGNRILSGQRSSSC